MILVVSIRTNYRIEELYRIEIPAPSWARYSLKPSRLNNEIIYPSADGWEIIARPLITIRGQSQRPWVYYIGTNNPQICISRLCHKTQGFLKIAPLSGGSLVAVDSKRGYIVDLLNDDIRMRNIGVKDIIGYAPYVDRSVVFIEERSLRRRIAALDQGFIYPITSFCLERREGHSLAAFESGSYTRIYYGADYGGYLLYDIKGSPLICGLGYKVASIVMKDRGSLYIGRNLYLETLLSSIAISWIPEEKVLLLYDEKSSWLLESDLRSFRPIARLPERPIYIGYTGEAHVIEMRGEIYVVRNNLLVKPEIGFEGVSMVSAISGGLALDTGDRVIITSIDGRILREVRKHRETTCWGYRDRVACMGRGYIGIIDPWRDDEIAIEARVESMPKIYIRRGGLLTGFHVDDSLEVVEVKRDAEDLIITVLPKAMLGAVSPQIEIEDLLGRYSSKITVETPTPSIRVDSYRVLIARGGISLKCLSQGLASVRLVLADRNGLGVLYRYRARIRSGDRIIGYSDFNIDREGIVDIDICIDETPASNRLELEIIGSRDSIDGDPFYRDYIDAEILDPHVDVEVRHTDDSSEVNVEVSNIDESDIETLSLRVRCSNTVFEKSAERSRTLSIRVGVCEYPARASVELVSRGFKWILVGDISAREIEECIEEYIARGALGSARCSHGGFFKHVEPRSIEDRSPLDAAWVTSIPGKGGIIALTAREPISYSLLSIGESIYKEGSLDPGFNIIELGTSPPIFPIRLCIYNGRAYRELLLEPQAIDDLVRLAVVTSYKLMEILGSML